MSEKGRDHSAGMWNRSANTGDNRMWDIDLSSTTEVSLSLITPRPFNVHRPRFSYIDLDSSLMTKGLELGKRHQRRLALKMRGLIFHLVMSRSRSLVEAQQTTGRGLGLIRCKRELSRMIDQGPGAIISTSQGVSKRSFTGFDINIQSPSCVVPLRCSIPLIYTNSGV